MMSIEECNWRFFFGRSKVHSFPREVACARYDRSGVAAESAVGYG